jgi:hypothetical protein
MDKAVTSTGRISAKVEHPFRVIKLHFYFAKVHYRCLAIERHG